MIIKKLTDGNLAGCVLYIAETPEENFNIQERAHHFYGEPNYTWPYIRADGVILEMTFMRGPKLRGKRLARQIHALGAAELQARGIALKDTRFTGSPEVRARPRYT
jgi:hypothetical protein